MCKLEMKNKKNTKQKEKYQGKFYDCYKLLARRKDWVAGAIISISVKDDDIGTTRFVATIEGWRNFPIYEGPLKGTDNIVQQVIDKVREIRDRLRNGDKKVLEENSMIKAGQDM